MHGCCSRKALRPLGTDAHKPPAASSGIVDKHRIINGFTKATALSQPEYMTRATGNAAVVRHVANPPTVATDLQSEKSLSWRTP